MQAQDAARVPLENIRVGLSANDWEEAVQEAAKPLLDSRAIRDEYVDAMLDGVKRLGPYIALMPGFALAHSVPSKSVLRTDMSVAVFDTPVRFSSNNDPIYVVMCLACKDKESHIERLQGIAQKFLDDTNLVDRMRGCKTAEELFSLLNE